MTAHARQAGFTGLTPFADALAWVAARTGRLDAEVIPARAACGRVLAQPLVAATGWPDRDRAAIDGWAVSARDTEGAGDYNPLPLAVAIPVVSGMAMPEGTDAVAAPHAVDCTGPTPLALATVARHAEVERRGSDVPAGFELAAGALRPEAVAVLELLAITGVTVTRQPRVAVLVAGAKSGPEVLASLLSELVVRDGGVPCHADDFAALPTSGLDLLLLVGRAGWGWDDDMAARLRADGGTLDMHGIAVRPGRSAGLGAWRGVPAILVPGTPASALSVYHTLAAPGIRRMAGLAPAPAARSCVLGRKVTSMVGITDVIQVRMSGDRAVPLGPADGGGLGRAALGDGWVVVPEGHEGHPAGATVLVYSAGRIAA